MTLYNEPFDDETGLPRLELTSDARIALRALSSAVLRGNCPFSAGDRAILLIHSPSQTLGGYWFHGKEFFIVLRSSSAAEAGARWNLLGVDWPLSTVPPGHDYLICSGESLVVRVLVGDSQTAHGPLTVFREEAPVASLDTLEVARARPRRGAGEFHLDFSGGDPDNFLKQAFHFSAVGTEGRIAMESEEASLTCDWPARQEPQNDLHEGDGARRGVGTAPPP